MEAKASPEWSRSKSLLGDKSWRINNLYRIQDEDGNDIRFRRNDAQRAYANEVHGRDLIVKARRLGFSTDIGIDMLDTCVFRSNVSAGLIDFTIKDASKKLAKILFAYERMPKDLRQAVQLIKSNTEELQWSNGSMLVVGTSYRGAGLNYLHVSEYGKISANSPDTANEIKTGALRAVPLSGRAVIESTAHGTSGEFYEVVTRAGDMAKEGRPLTALDWRLHFFGWWVKREHRLPNNLVVESQELRKYFDEVAPILRDRHGITLDADQRAWYAKQFEDLGPDDVKSEFPTLAEECFYRSTEGSFWKAELARARRDGRIGQPMPFDPSRRVNTAWDIGENCTAIWFHQTDGMRHRFIDYYEEEGGSLQKCAALLEEKRRDRGFQYERHYGPHDIGNREWGSEAKSRKAIAMDLGVEFTIVSRIEHKGDSIEAARRMLNNAWFDSQHCSVGVSRLDNYRKKWNKALAVFMSEPVDDENSHGSDAIQQLAMGILPSKDKGEKRPQPERSKSAWGA